MAVGAVVIQSQHPNSLSGCLASVKSWVMCGTNGSYCFSLNHSDWTIAEMTLLRTLEDRKCREASMDLGSTSFSSLDST